MGPCAIDVHCGISFIIEETGALCNGKMKREIVSKVKSDKCRKELDKLYKKEMLQLYEPQNFRL